MITGGARGQGAAEGKLFRAEGAEVYLTDVLVDEGIETAAEIGATFIEHDVTDSDAWTAIVKRIENEHAHLDVLINNAGIFHMMGMADTERELWDRTIAINQTGVFSGSAGCCSHYDAPEVRDQLSTSHPSLVCAAPAAHLPTVQVNGPCVA